MGDCVCCASVGYRSFEEEAHLRSHVRYQGRVTRVTPLALPIAHIVSVRRGLRDDCDATAGSHHICDPFFKQIDRPLSSPLLSPDGRGARQETAIEMGLA